MMAIRYYDDAIAEKLQRWIPDNSTLRVLKPDETKRFFEIHADDLKDRPFTLPIITLSRDKDIEIIRNTKNSRTFDGLRLATDNTYYDTALSGAANTIADKTALLNVIPIKVNYQLDIYTKTYEEGDEYVRNFIFKLINNPTFTIEIPYNNMDYRHTANLRVMSTVSDTSDISERLFPGQFTRWTIQLELQDGFLFSIPYRKNWRLIDVELEVENKLDLSITTEMTMTTAEENETEVITQIVAPTMLTMLDTEKTLKHNESYKLDVLFTPEFVAEMRSSNFIKWETSDENVAIVTSNGTVWGRQPGTATITARSFLSETVYTTCEITVIK